MSKTETRTARVLVFAPIGRDTAASVDLLRKVGLHAEGFSNLQHLAAALGDDVGAVFIAEEALIEPGLSALADWVTRQPPWSDLPFVMLTSHQEQPAVAAWRQKVAASLRNVSLLERPVHAMTLVSAVRAALRARLRQSEVRLLLDQQRQASLRLEQLIVERTYALGEANAELRSQIAERSRVEKTLRQSQKMEAIGQLTGGVAHDFNNLLQVISGGLDMLDRQKDPARRARLLDGMKQAAQRGAGLTRQLLAFSRSQELKPEPVDIARQIGGMRELLDRSLRGNVHVDLHFDDDLWPTEVDPGELELVVLNLAVNSRDAMPDGGTISISGQNAGDVAVGDSQGDYVCLSIADTGEGMSPEVKERVFEPFFTTKDIGHGSGLGLAHVHGFAKQSGGAVKIKTEVGNGTTITLLLPRSQRSPKPDERHSVDHISGGKPHASVGSVLLVEDDDEVAALVTEMLDQLGYDVTRAACVEAALGALSNHRKVDLIFSDIMMPGGRNGIDLAREVRKRNLKIPFLLTSGYAQAAQNEADAEGIRILPKPYRIDDLAIALRKAVKRKSR